MKQKSEIFDFDLSLMQLLGPVFLLCTLTLAAKSGSSFQYDLLAVGAIGLFLSAKLGIRGCAYALLLLGVVSLIKHGFFIERHALQFGLEGSVAFALLISGMSSEEGRAFYDSLAQKIGTKEQTIQNLEEEIRRGQEAASNEQMIASDKLAALSQTIEEIQADSSALHVLNDVLRQNGAKIQEEKERLADYSLQNERKIGELMLQLEELQKDYARLKAETPLAQQNEDLFRELNGARVKEAQTHLINETLVRMHAKEAAKAKLLEEKAFALDAEASQLKQQLSLSKGEATMYVGQVEQLAAELQALKEKAKEFDLLLEEKNFVQDRLRKAEEELGGKNERLTHLHRQCEELELRMQSSSSMSKGEAHRLASEKDHLMSQLAELRQHLTKSGDIEARYRQLKTQFEERNQVLHQVRAQLFQTDTQLQTIKQELDQRNLEFNPVPPPLQIEISNLEQENGQLLQENQMLQDLVTHLVAQTEDSPPPAVKKKVKKSPPPEQASLF